MTNPQVKEIKIGGETGLYNETSTSRKVIPSFTFYDYNSVIPRLWLSGWRLDTSSLCKMLSYDNELRRYCVKTLQLTLLTLRLNSVIRPTLRR